MTRSLATVARSRRAALKLLAAALGGGALTRFELAEVAAGTCRQVGDGCRRRRQCCSGRCRGMKGKKTCRGHHAGTCKRGDNVCKAGAGATCGDGCSCFMTTGGAPFCGRFAFRAACHRDKECEAEGAGRGAACVRNDGACEVESATFCAARCSGVEA